MCCNRPWIASETAQRAHRTTSHLDLPCAPEDLKREREREREKTEREEREREKREREERWLEEGGPLTLSGRILSRER